MPDASIRITPELLPIVSLGVLVMTGVSAGDDAPTLGPALAEAERRVREAPPPERLATRALYRQAGLDPTRRRPSSEALLRRVLKGDALPRINTAVDVCNWCSLELQLPFGLYDLDRVAPPVELRLGRPGEQYVGIRKDTVHVAGRMTLADELGAFGNPSADSARTMVTTAATRLLVVVFAARQTAPAVLPHALDLTSGRIAEMTGGAEAARSVV